MGGGGFGGGGGGGVKLVSCTVFHSKKQLNIDFDKVSIYILEAIAKFAKCF